MDKLGKLKKIFKFITDVITWTCLCILILIGICIVWYVVSAKIYASRGEKYTPYFSLYTIISPSMEPKIKVYDVILDTRVDDYNKIKVGDVITFISTGNLSNGMTITHRVIEKVQTNEGLRFRTKGDNNVSPDGALVIPENILGKTLLKIPKLGRIQFLVGTKGGWIIIILIPALGIIVYDLLKLFKVSGLKNRVDNILKIEEKDTDENKKEKEDLRKQELKEKLNINNDLPQVKTEIQMPKINDEQNKEVNNFELPKIKENNNDIEIPKLKDETSNNDK